LSDIILETRNLSKTYVQGKLQAHALKQVDMRVEGGEIVSIMGPSGCGKSTLLNLLGGLDRPTAGEIIVDGENISRLSDLELTTLRLTKIGFIFQSYNLIPTLTALENVELPLSILGAPSHERRSVALSMLRDVGLLDKADSKPYELSGGEQQRVAIARSLVNDPKIVLADEPTGNLDSENSKAIMALIKEKAGEGQTFIVITHNPEVAGETDRTLHMKDGYLTETEATQKTPITPYVDLELKRKEAYNRLDELDWRYLSGELNHPDYEQTQREHLRKVVDLEVQLACIPKMVVHRM